MISKKPGKNQAKAPNLVTSGGGRGSTTTEVLVEGRDSASVAKNVSSGPSRARANVAGALRGGGILDGVACS